MYRCKYNRKHRSWKPFMNCPSAHFQIRSRRKRLRTLTDRKFVWHNLLMKSSSASSTNNTHKGFKRLDVPENSLTSKSHWPPHPSTQALYHQMFHRQGYSNPCEGRNRGWKSNLQWQSQHSKPKHMVHHPISTCRVGNTLSMATWAVQAVRG